MIRIDPIGCGPDFHRWPLSEGGHSCYREGLQGQEVGDIFKGAAEIQAQVIGRGLLTRS